MLKKAAAIFAALAVVLVACSLGGVDAQDAPPITQEELDAILAWQLIFGATAGGLASSLSTGDAIDGSTRTKTATWTNVKGLTSTADSSTYAIASEVGLGGEADSESSSYSLSDFSYESFAPYTIADATPTATQYGGSSAEADADADAMGSIYIYKHYTPEFPCFGKHC